MTITVTPITYDRVGYLPSGASYRHMRIARTKYTQKPCVGDPLPYVSFRAYYDEVPQGIRFNNGAWVYSESDIQNGVISSRLGSGFSGPFASALTLATNSAYGRMRDRFYGDSASLGETFGEARQSLEMMYSRLEQLKNAAVALKAGNLGKFAGILRIKLKKKHRHRWSRPQQASGLWLEYWLGWAPLVNDIYTAAQVLSQPCPQNGIRVSGSRTIRVQESGVIGIQTSSSHNTFKLSGQILVRQGAVFLVTNPNMYLATRLGLINPLTVAWALVPMSFVVNWFVNVDKFLNSLTDFAGVNVSRPNTVTHASCHVASTRDETNGNTNYATKTCYSISSGFRMTRSTGLTLPKLAPIPMYRLSPTRGATAISLIVSLFSPRA